MAKGQVLNSVWDSLSDERKARIQAHTDILETEYLSLQELRKTAGLTQARVSEGLNMPQSNVSRLEQSSDMLLSTLRGYIEAIGGKLNITVDLPNKPSITVKNLGDLIE